PPWVQIPPPPPKKWREVTPVLCSSCETPNQTLGILSSRVDKSRYRRTVLPQFTAAYLPTGTSIGDIAQEPRSLRLIPDRSSTSSTGPAPRARSEESSSTIT